MVQRRLSPAAATWTYRPSATSNQSPFLGSLFSEPQATSTMENNPSEKNGRIGLSPVNSVQSHILEDMIDRISYYGKA
jgi:hypothetical protein